MCHATDKGLGVKLALNQEDKAIGMIQYLPVEHSYAEGKNLYAILCTWVHGYKIRCRKSSEERDWNSLTQGC